MSPYRLGPLGCCLLTLCALPLAVYGDETPSKSPRLSENAGPMAIFRAADADKNGNVSWEELKAVRPAFPEDRFKQMDKNSNGFIERAEVPRPQQRNANNASIDRNDRARYVAKLIASHDQDQSGDVTLAEIQADKPGFPKSTFGTLDRDKNGALGSADLGAPAPEARKDPSPSTRPKATPRGKLQEADSNKDGKLSFEEARVAFPNITQARFDQRDRDGDGFLSPKDRQGRKPSSPAE